MLVILYKLDQPKTTYLHTIYKLKNIKVHLRVLIELWFLFPFTCVSYFVINLKILNTDYTSVDLYKSNDINMLSVYNLL